MSACYSTVNPNQAATGSPGRMEDGRLFTDYRPRCFQYPLKAAQTWGDNEYRARMIHGAEELMDAARQLNNRKATAVSCVDTMVPELYKRVCTWQGCKVVPGNPMGIGVGRIYVPAAEGAAGNPQRAFLQPHLQEVVEYHLPQLLQLLYAEFHVVSHHLHLILMREQEDRILVVKVREVV